MVGVVLVGGKSRRFGRNKALEPFQGERLIDRQIRTLRSVFPEVLIITNEPEPYLDLDVAVARDVIPEQGPLGGIYTGLLFAQHENIFVIACDMPFVQPAVIRHMEQLAGGYDVVIPQKEDGLEPLHAIYSSRCLPHIRGMLERGVLQVISFFPAVKVCRLTAEEIGQLDPVGLSFFNINTPGDMAKAKEVLATRPVKVNP
ncbi:MAG: molybdenum cofactor guanylyltransferase [Deltaproteobacteria bacterium]|nr:MAG: molybdenum cofactor guanylyltransferase [Deltaproteobacteria bacterium]